MERKGGNAPPPHYLPWLPLCSHPLQTLPELLKSRWLYTACQPSTSAVTPGTPHSPARRGKVWECRKVNSVGCSPGHVPVRGLEVLTLDCLISKQSSPSSPQNNRGSPHSHLWYLVIVPSIGDTGYETTYRAETGISSSHLHKAGHTGGTPPLAASHKLSWLQFLKESKEPA